MADKPDKPEKQDVSPANEDNEEKERTRARQRSMRMLSFVVIIITLAAAFFFGEELYEPQKAEKAAVPTDSTAQLQGASQGPEEDSSESASPFAWIPWRNLKYLYPYLLNLSGVLLFIMSTARKKRDSWDPERYSGDYWFRVAQSFAYLFFILWAWPKGTGNDGIPLPPVIIGFLVGMFILRVERAMEALGEKFGETLLTILPRSTQFIKAEEKRRRQTKMLYKVDDLKTQYDVLRGQIDDPSARDTIDAMITDAEGALKGEDDERLRDTVDRLTWTFDEVKKSAGEVLVPLEEVLGGKLAKEDEK